MQRCSHTHTCKHACTLTHTSLWACITHATRRKKSSHKPQKRCWCPHSPPHKHDPLQCCCRSLYSSPGPCTHPKARPFIQREAIHNLISPSPPLLLSLPPPVPKNPPRRSLPFSTYLFPQTKLFPLLSPIVPPEAWRRLHSPWPQ